MGATGRERTDYFRLHSESRMNSMRNYALERAGLDTARTPAALPPPQHGPRSRVAKTASMGLMYGGKLQDHLNQLKNIDYARIERRVMARFR